MIAQEARGGQLARAARAESSGLNAQSKLENSFTCGIPACFSRRANSRSARRVSSSLHEQIEELQGRERRGVRLLRGEAGGFGHAGEPEMPETGRELGIHQRSSKV